MSTRREATTAGFRLRSSADGWRGVVGAGFSPESAAALGRCAAERVAAERPVSVTLVTYDGRRCGEAAARAVAEAVGDAVGGRVRLVPHLPTPTAAAAVRLGHADLALLVTASHNPPSCNGLKLKVRPGGPPSEELDAAITERYETGPGPGDDLTSRSSTSVPAPVPAPVPAARRDLVAEHIGDVPGRLPAPGGRRLRVVVDGLGGVAGGPVARLCAALGWETRRVGRDLDADFNGLVPDPSLPASRARAAGTVTAWGADLGLVLDGDGDRLYVVDHLGRTAHPHELLALLLQHRHADPSGIRSGASP